MVRCSMKRGYTKRRNTKRGYTKRRNTKNSNFRGGTDRGSAYEGNNVLEKEVTDFLLDFGMYYVHAGKVHDWLTLHNDSTKVRELLTLSQDDITRINRDIPGDEGGLMGAIAVARVHSQRIGNEGALGKKSKGMKRKGKKSKGKKSKGKKSKGK